MKKWYQKQLLSYFPIFLLTITLIVLIGMVTVSDISRRETERANEIFARYISEMIVGSLDEVEQAFLKEFTLNDEMMDFLDGSKPNSQQEDIQLYEVASSLRSLQNDYSLIQSIYLYRASDGLVIMSDGKSELDPFYDRDFLKRQLSGPLNTEEWSEARAVPSSYDDGNTPVISLVKPLPIPFGKEGIAVINVKVEGFANDIQMGKNRNITYLDIVDRDGQVVLSSEEALEGEEEQSKIDFLAQRPIENTGWTIRSGIKSGQFFQWFELISYTWIAVGVAVIALSTVYVVYISKRNYKPIALILNKLETIQLKSALNKTEEGDVRFIETALEELTAQMKEYERESQDNLLTKKRQLFIDLIEGSVTEFDEFWQEPIPLLQEQHRKRYKWFLVADIETDSLNLEPEEQALVRLALQNMLQDFFSSEECPSWCEWIYGNRLGIVAPAGSSPYSEAEIIALTDKCQDWVKGQFDLSFMFGAGAAFETWQEAPRSYQGAKEALEYRLTRRYANVIFTDRIQEEAGQKWMQVWPLIMEIAEMFQMRNEGWSAKVDLMFEQFKSQKMSDQSIYTMIGSLLKSIQKKAGEGILVLDASTSLPNSGNEADSRRYFDDLPALADEVRDILHSAYGEYVAIYENGGFHSTMLEIREYIMAHFDDPDLSLKHLSDRFQLQGKNVSQLFKEAFGENFVDFVLQLRIGKAKRLLVESEMPQQEIAMLVGYSNSITFGRMFKRVVGMTPGEFRRQNAG
ncbi:helix-turn-helix domain-containing protein [Paenibacillus sp. URB8-2]|uniref:helix-turn-helix domain-containing protein n=1 Tax=Paenibacillus sp. URB8-2 TaxID=2741301 RepID=UPI0015BFD3C5|nr:helix-turn-helix domain-containing protein [Paenibacillus sp. URB8-2]